MSTRRIRHAVLADRLELTAHALEEMDEDGLTEADVHRVLRTGKIVAELTNDPRGHRYIVRGLPKGSSVEAEVVCRFLPSGMLRVITVYSVKE